MYGTPDLELTGHLPLKLLDEELWDLAAEDRPGGFDARDAQGRRILVTFDPEHNMVHYHVKNPAGRTTAIYYTTMQELAGCVLDAHRTARSFTM